MGASNVMAAYLLYAGKVPPLSMQCLVYMALVSKDADQQPWYGQGHEALAAHALGRPVPITESDLRAVRRAVTPLLADGIESIEIDRRPGGRRDGPRTIRYRLNLDTSAGRKPSAVGDAQRRTKSGLNAGRKVSQRRTKSVPAPDENRPPEEEEEQEERGEEEVVALPTEVQTARADEPNQEQDRSEVVEEEATTKPSGAVGACGHYLDPDGTCFVCAEQRHQVITVARCAHRGCPKLLKIPQDQAPPARWLCPEHDGKEARAS